MDYSGKYDKNTENELIKQQRETLKNNALFNIDFDEYKRQVRDELKELQNKLSKLDYVSDSTPPITNNNFHLFTGIVLVTLAIIMIILS